MPFIETLILFAITLALSELLKPKPQTENARPSDLGDFSFPTATEGRPVPIIFGTVKLSAPNVIWFGDLRQTAIKEKIKTGLFSKKTIITGYRYALGIQMAISRGPLTSVLRIWVDDEELWSGTQTSDGTIQIDEPEFFGGEDGAGGIKGPVTIKLGALTQSVPGYLETHQTVGGATPAYNGTAYILLERVELGTSTSIRPWAFEARRIPNGLSLGTPSVNSGNDANPMNIIYEILTNTEWGLGLPGADINTTTFAAAAEVLRQEGNGISLVLDSPREASDFLDEIQRQIDGVVYLNRASGLWDIKLARDDYNINDALLADPGNVIEVDNFTRGSWAETQNIILVQFTSRARDYQVTYAVAQDMANIRNQGGEIVKSEVRYPGIKDPVLANSICWRELRFGSFPVAKARLIVNREFSTVSPGDVIAWTDPNLGFTMLPMRVLRADFGQLGSGKIALDLIQDVFQAFTPSFASPGAGDWTPPLNNVVNIPADSRTIFEAPRAFTDREPDSPGLVPRIWVGLRSQGDGAITTSIVRTSDQLEIGTVAGFLLHARLNTALSPSHNLTGTLTIEAVPDTKTEILQELSIAALADIGSSLSNLILVGDEFMAYTGFSDPGGNTINLTGLVRGLLDSVPPMAGHADETPVIFLHLSGAVTDTAFPGDSSVTLRPLPSSNSETLAFASATTSTIAMDSRHLRPYPPINPRSTGASSAYDLTTSLDATGIVPGGGENSSGCLFSFTRRDFRLEDEYLKVAGETRLPADFPVVNTTEYRLVVRDGAAAALYTGAWSNVNNPGISRNRVLAGNSGTLPAALQVTVETRHVVDSITYTSAMNLAVAMTPTSEVTAWTPLGAIANAVVSTLWVAPSTGSYACTIGDALSTGAFQVRINGGSWTDVITGATASGNFSATSGDDLEFRHTASASGEHRFALVDPPTGTNAFAILVL